MINVNFMPKRMALAKARNRRVRKWLCAVGWALVALIGAWGVDGTRRVEAGSLRNEIMVLQSRLQEGKGELAKTASQAHVVLRQIEHADALRAKRPWSSLLQLVAESMPEGCWLISLGTDPAVPGNRVLSRKAVSKEDVKNEAIVIQSPRKLRLVGYATNDDESFIFVERLKKSNAFQSVNLLKSKREPHRDGFYYRFEIACEW